jgi:hypothetical protein
VKLAVWETGLGASGENWLQQPDRPTLSKNEWSGKRESIRLGSISANFWPIQTMHFHFPDDAFSRLLNDFVSFEMFQGSIVWMIVDPTMMRHQAKRW